MTCCAVRPYLQAYVDSELSPERAIEVEQHLGQCSECSAEVEMTRSLCKATRQSVTNAALCPQFRARLSQCVSAERKRQENQAFDPLSWRVVMPLAAAACMTLVLSSRFEMPDIVTALIQKSSDTDRASALESDRWHGGFSPELNEASSSDGLVDFLIRHHAARYEPEVVEPASVNHMEPQLGFRISPPDLARYGAHFEGANFVLVNRTRAAVLHYSMGGKRVTLYVYDPEELPLRTQRLLTPKVVGDRAVFVGHRRGYSIATCESEGVGYAVTTDLTGEESAELVAHLDL